MKFRHLYMFACVAVLLGGASCIVSSSLNYGDKDTEGALNLLSNPGFRAYTLDSDAALVGWTVQSDTVDPKNMRVVIDGTEASEGNSSLRIDASKHSVILLSDAFRVRRYGGYYARIRARSSQVQGPQITVRFMAFSETGGIISRQKSRLKTNQDWKKGSVSSGFHKPGVSFGRLQIIIPPFSQGSLWLDDAGCWEVQNFRID